MSRRALAAVALMGLAVGWLGYLPAQEAWEAEAARPRVIFGGDIAWKPYEWLDEDGLPQGFHIDLMKALAEVMGLNLEIRLGPWEEIRRLHQQGQIDVIATCRTRWREQAEGLIFSHPLRPYYEQMFIRRDGPELRDLKDLHGRRVVLVAETAMHQRLVQEVPGAILMHEPTEADVLRALAAGRAEAAVVSQIGGILSIREYRLTNLKPAGPPIYVGDYCLAVRAENRALLDQVNQGLEILRASRQYEAIYDRWFGQLEKRLTLSQALRTGAWVLGPLAALLGVALVWSWMLRRQVARATANLQRELQHRRQIEAELREKQALIDQFLENSPTAIFIKDIQGRYTYVNRHTLQALHLSPEQILGRTASEIFPPEQAEEYIAHDQQVLRENRPIIFEELDTAEGRRRICLTVKFPLRSTDGRPYAICGIAMDITERLEAERRQRLLMSELDHRVKNNLAIILAILRQTASRARSIDEFVASLTGRIEAMARVHEILAQSRWSSLSLEVLIRWMLSTITHDRPHAFSLAGPPVELPPKMLTALASVLHELATNALKHGSLSVPQGQVRINWIVSDQHLKLEWVEENGPPVPAQPGSGWGTQVIRGLIEHDLEGHVDLSFRPEGLHVHIEVPLPAGSSAANRQASELSI